MKEYFPGEDRIAGIHKAHKNTHAIYDLDDLINLVYHVGVPE
jgi:hypothetical protein